MKKLFLVLIIINLFSCTFVEDPVVDLTKKIYVGGYEKNTNGIKIAKIWKNGQEILLGNGINDSEVKSIQVVNNDVYAVGYEKNTNGNDQAILWRNGIKTKLTNSNLTSFANTLFIINSDVYVGGGEKNANGIFVAKIWKNGQETALSNGVTNATVNDIFVDGNTIYACGGGLNNAGTFISKVWKNGQELYDLNTSNEAVAISICVSDNKVYVVGSHDNNTGQSQAAFWKNGERTDIGSGICNDVFVTNEIEAIVFNETNAKVYKNGEILTLDSASASVKSLFVLGNEIYVAGVEYITGSINTIGKLWINGVGTNITNGNSEVQLNTIFVL